MPAPVADKQPVECPNECRLLAAPPPRRIRRPCLPSRPDLDFPAITLASWSYALATIAYALLTVRFMASARTGLRGAALIVALVATLLWAAGNWGFIAFRRPGLLLAANGLDILRAAAWQVLLLFLLREPGKGADRESAYGRLWPATFVLTLTTLLAQVLAFVGFNALGDPARLALFGALALSIYGLVLLEQLWRNTVEDARWSIKPLCLGLAAVWAFDVYHFADALLFSRLDPDLWVARGFVYTLVVPVLAVSAFRVRADVFRVRLSRRVVFHTATLVAAGAYLLFMAGAGYYVRYFGGEWGRAVQVALLFGAALALGLVIVSGSMRAKMRVFVGKHFFSYRYDYRDEWLRFTQALAATGSQPEMGQQIVRALADLVESPAGALWVRDAGGRVFAQAAHWNMPEDASEEPVDSPLSTFLRDSGWVVNLEEYRSSPLRYGDLELPEWLRHTPHAWLVVPLGVGSDLIGFAILATARTQLDVNWEVNDLLKTAARQAASFLGQMRAAEALHRGAQVRRLQPDVGVRRPRPQEHRVAALADAEERRAPSRQPGVPEGHAGDRRALGRADEAADAAAARRNDAGQRAAGRRARRSSSSASARPRRRSSRCPR